MFSSPTQFLMVDAKGIFALFTFVMPRQKEFMSLSIKDYRMHLNAYHLDLLYKFTLSESRLHSTRNLNCFIAKHSVPKQLSMNNN